MRRAWARRPKRIRVQDASAGGSRLTGFLGVRPGESRAVVPALAFAFGGVGAMTLSSIAQDALFVTTFSLGALSRFTVVSAAVRVIVAFLYAALARRFVGARLDGALLGATAIAMAASGAAVLGTPS